MRLLYNILFIVFFTVSSPYYFWRLWRRGNWKRGFMQRFGEYDRNLQQSLTNRHVVWVHAVSVGEMNVCVAFVSALQVLRIMMDTGKPLSELLKTFVKFPQIAVNMKVREKPALETMPDVLAAVKDAEQTLGDTGRVLLRYSGTEPKIRLLIEGRDAKQIRALADGIAAKIKAKIGA